MQKSVLHQPGPTHWPHQEGSPGHTHSHPLAGPPVHRHALQAGTRSFLGSLLPDCLRCYRLLSGKRYYLTGIGNVSYLEF